MDFSVSDFRHDQDCCVGIDDKSVTQLKKFPTFPRHDSLQSRFEFFSQMTVLNSTKHSNYMKENKIYNSVIKLFESLKDIKAGKGKQLV